jgi:hypothetical protein
VIDSLIARLAEGTVLAPLVPFAVGVLLSLSPLALRSLSVVVSAVAPRSVDAAGRRRRPYEAHSGSHLSTHCDELAARQSLLQAGRSEAILGDPTIRWVGHRPHPPCPPLHYRSPRAVLLNEIALVSCATTGRRSRTISSNATDQEMTPMGLAVLGQ